MISAIQVSYYPLGAQVMTLVLPLGFFILVMMALYFIFTRPHTIPGHRPVSGARPVAPPSGAAPSTAAATGFPTATAGGGPEPLADRGTPPVVGAAGDDTAVDDTAADGTASGEAGPTESSEGSE